MHNFVKRFIILILLTTLIGCSPKTGSVITTKQPALNDTAFVLVLKVNDDFVNDGIKVGTITSTDNGFSTNCSYNEIIGTLIKMSRKYGANVIKITKRDFPDRKSTCDRVVADIYRVPDYRKHEIEIEWSATRKLTWADFKGKPSGLYAAFAAGTEASIELESNALDLFTKAKFFTKNVFICYTSFVRKTALAHPEVLRHEQAHFDLAEVHRRLLQQKLDSKKYGLFNLKEVQNEARINDKLYQKISAVYDTETNHGTIADKQKEWELRIARELLELKAFEKPVYFF